MSIWDDLDKEASVDNRIGNHEFLVDKVTPGNWEDGRPYYELDGRLTTASNFNLRQRLSPAPPEDFVRANKASWDQRMKRSISLAHQNDEVLAKEYGTSLDKIQPGQTFRVKTDYESDKRDKTKKYVKLISFLPKTAKLSGNGLSADDIPF